MATKLLESALQSLLNRYEAVHLKVFETREDGFGSIWILTSGLNLYGSTCQLKAENIAKLSDDLSRWYFRFGLVISNDTKDRYFLAQDVLSVLVHEKQTAERPEPSVLHLSGITRDRLRDLRTSELGLLPDRPRFRRKKTRISNRLLNAAVSIWKHRVSAGFDNPSQNWLLLQCLFSELRSCLMRDLRG